MVSTETGSNTVQQGCTDYVCTFKMRLTVQRALTEVDKLSHVLPCLWGTSTVYQQWIKLNVRMEFSLPSIGF